MAAPTPTRSAGAELRYLVVIDGDYAEAENGRFYAFRGRANDDWTLVSRDREFTPYTFPTVQACDAALGFWLAVQDR